MINAMKGKILLNAVFFFVFVGGVYGQGPVWEWARDIGGKNHEGPSADGMIRDANGDIYITGNFSSDTINVGNIILTNKGSYTDFFIAKYGATGNVMWAKSF